ncbi:hypothetical protein U1Q18_009886 [Sarracenia purpurea var. burkii]
MVAEDDRGILGVKVSDLNPKLTKQEQVGPSLGVLEEGDASLRNVAGEADEGLVEASLLVGYEKNSIAVSKKDSWANVVASGGSKVDSRSSQGSWQL